MRLQVLRNFTGSYVVDYIKDKGIFHDIPLDAKAVDLIVNEEKFTPFDKEIYLIMVNLVKDYDTAKENLNIKVDEYFSGDEHLFNFFSPIQD